MRPLNSLPGVLLVLCLSTGCLLPADSRQADTPRDSVISADVESQLAEDRFGGLSNILVATEEGTVTLTGTVERAERKAKAAELTRQVKGVRRVKNDIDIRADGSP